MSAEELAAVLERHRMKVMRDRFASFAMFGFLANGANERYGIGHAGLAELSFAVADAMVAFNTEGQ